MIVGRDLLKALSINLDFGNDVIQCTRGTFNGCSTPMKNIDDVIKFKGYDILNEINESERSRRSYRASISHTGR